MIRIIVVFLIVVINVALSYHLKLKSSLLKRLNNNNIRLYAEQVDKDDLWYDRIQYVDLNANVEPSATARPMPLFLLGKVIHCDKINYSFSIQNIYTFYH